MTRWGPIEMQNSELRDRLAEKDVIIAAQASDLREERAENERLREQVRQAQERLAAYRADFQRIQARSGE